MRATAAAACTTDPVAHLHRNVDGFGEDAAEAYERGRAGFPPVVLDALGLAPGSRVLDLAAGTGLLAGALQDAGHDVVAVEPMPAMRSRLARRIGERRTLDGTAEAIPLDDATVDAVVVADAFHWFDGPAAVAEIHRVLRPDGRCVLVWRAAEWPDAPEWWRRLWARMDRLRGDHPGFVGDQGRGAFDRHGGFTALQHTTVDFDKTTDVEGMLANLRSISYVGLLPENVRRALLDDVRADLKDARVGTFVEPQRAHLWATRRR
ncbi:methyltransferase domain-containing protein [Conexibacter sp. W3-3-2]|nr:methyltransferase domain-containing protein [Conexibacter sp. W3-3-2]